MLNFNRPPSKLLSKTHHLPSDCLLLMWQRSHHHILHLFPQTTMHYQLFSWLGSRHHPTASRSNTEQCQHFLLFLNKKIRTCTTNRASETYCNPLTAESSLQIDLTKVPRLQYYRLSSATANQQSLACLCIMYTTHMHTPQHLFGIRSRKCQHCNG